MKEVLETITQLGDHQHLRREKALNKVAEILAASGETTHDHHLVMITFFKQMLNSRRWEDRFGAINGVLALITAEKIESAVLDTFLWDYILTRAFPELLIDEEFRVRNQTALLLKAIVSSDRSGKGVQHFDQIKAKILGNIMSTFERDISGDASGSL